MNERGESRFLKRRFCRQNRSRCRRHTEFCICSMLKLDRLELIFWYWLVVCLKGIDVMGDFIAYRSYVFYYFPVNSDLSGESRVDLSDQLSGIFVILFIIGRNHWNYLVALLYRQIWFLIIRSRLLMLLT